VAKKLRSKRQTLDSRRDRGWLKGAAHSSFQATGKITDKMVAAGPLVVLERRRQIAAGTRGLGAVHFHTEGGSGNSLPMVRPKKGGRFPRMEG